MERSRLRPWLLALALVVLAFIATVITLNLTVYSAPGFVSSYLGSLSRHDLTGALDTPGVRVTAGSRALLRADALGELGDIRLFSDSARSDGTHSVVFSYRANGVVRRSSFSVERDGTRFGLFSAWRFSTSPTSLLTVTPLHAATFTANGVDLAPKAGQDLPTAYAVLVPSAFSLTHHSTWLTAPVTTAVVATPGIPVSASVNVSPKPSFTAEAQREIDAYLAQCVTQKVLLPTGCPMGQQISNRIQDSPTWSMVDYPVIRIVPGSRAASWLIPATQGTAHLVVAVKSIFDGSLSTFDRDVPFTVSYLITFQADGGLLISAQG